MKRITFVLRSLNKNPRKTHVRVDGQPCSFVFEKLKLMKRLFSNSVESADENDGFHGANDCIGFITNIISAKIK